MDFYEVEGKALFRRFDIDTDSGVLLQSGESIPELPFPCVVKAQALSGHRGQNGGIRVAHDRETLVAAVRAIEALELGGERIPAVLLVPACDIRNEHYLGITIDTLERKRVLLYTPCGGMDIERVAAETPDKLLRIDVTHALDAEALAEQIAGCGVDEALAARIAGFGARLYKLFMELDATSAEINPLAELRDGGLIALDAKLSIDDNALFRQDNYCLIPRKCSATPLEQAAINAGMSYVEVDGEGTVGLLVFGAGLGMATLDTAKYYGLRPINFADLGSRMDGDCFRLGIRLMMQKPNLKAVLINGYGGQFSTSQVVAWILDGIDELGNSGIPVVVKVRGYRAQEGWDMLDARGIPVVRYGTTDDAVKLLKKLLEAVA